MLAAMGVMQLPCYTCQDDDSSLFAAGRLAVARLYYFAKMQVQKAYIQCSHICFIDTGAYTTVQPSYGLLLSRIGRTSPAADARRYALGELAQ